MPTRESRPATIKLSDVIATIHDENIGPWQWCKKCGVVVAIPYKHVVGCPGRDYHTDDLEGFVQWSDEMARRNVAQG